jgi:hypothetical protein
MKELRMCYYAPIPDKDGIIRPVMVTEDSTEFEPVGWEWEVTLKEAQATVREYNAKLGLTPMDVDDILFSAVYPIAGNRCSACGEYREGHYERTSLVE